MEIWQSLFTSSEIKDHPEGNGGALLWHFFVRNVRALYSSYACTVYSTRSSFRKAMEEKINLFTLWS